MSRENTAPKQARVSGEQPSGNPVRVTRYPYTTVYVLAVLLAALVLALVQ